MNRDLAFAVEVVCTDLEELLPWPQHQVHLILLLQSLNTNRYHLAYLQTDLRQANLEVALLNQSRSSTYDVV